MQSRNGIIGWGNYGGSDTNAFRLNDGGTLVNYWFGNDLYATANVVDASWHHVAATFDGTTRKIFVDGVQLASDIPTPNNILSPVTNVRIGSTYFGEYFDGSMKEVRIWNIARSSSQLTSGMAGSLGGNETGLVAYYKMGDGTGTTVTNSASASSGINGTLVNGPAWLSAPSGTGNWSGSSLTVVRTGGASLDDQFSGAGNLATMTAASGNVVLSGTGGECARERRRWRGGSASRAAVAVAHKSVVAAQL